MEIPGISKRQVKMTPEMRNFLRRRTLPFLNDHGLSRAPLSFVLEEVYLQGMRDAVQTMEESNGTAGPLQGNVSEDGPGRDAPSGIAC
jgi:hypothetical protein